MAASWARWALVVLVAGAIFYGSTATPSALPQAPSLSDKAYHGISYAALALSLAFATMGSRVWRPARTGLIMVLTIGYGLFMEVLQGPLPTRSFDLLDIAADALGALIVVPWMLLERRFARRS